MNIQNILDHAWRQPFTTKCDFARTHADLVAVAASDGFITTRIAAGLYGNRWQITAPGLRHLEALKG